MRPATDESGALGEDAVMLAEIADVIVDAVFGTGFTGAAKGPAAAVIQLMNDVPTTVVSVDIMSGVGAGSGAVHGPAVIADLTVALHAAKVGHFVTPGGAFSGEVVVAAIGIPTLCDQAPDVWLLTEEAMADLIVPKGALDHKRSVGTVLRSPDASIAIWLCCQVILGARGYLRLGRSFGPARRPSRPCG